jgi:protein-S-isoprenylcysteine O-methyltransferase Ste14
MFWQPLQYTVWNIPFSKEVNLIDSLLIMLTESITTPFDCLSFIGFLTMFMNSEDAIKCTLFSVDSSRKSKPVLFTTGVYSYPQYTGLLAMILITSVISLDNLVLFFGMFLYLKYSSCWYD